MGELKKSVLRLPISHGHHGDAGMIIRGCWRYDPAMVAFQGNLPIAASTRFMASFVMIRLKRLRICLHHFQSAIEDDAMVNFRRLGAQWRLWTSSVAIGRQHGFEIQIFGENGGLKWFAEQPIN